MMAAACGAMNDSACPQDAGDALSALMSRIAATRVLMEHQVWEAVRVLDAENVLVADLRHSDAFRSCMEQRRLGGAVEIIAAHCRATRTEGTNGDERTVPPARHADASAAGLLMLLRDADRARRAHETVTPADALRGRLKGIITDLVTPFRHGAIDRAGLRALVDWQIDQGISGLSPCGIAGEGSSLTAEERAQVIRICVDASRGHVPVIPATGTNNTESTVSLTRNAKALGADAALVVVPYYSKPSQAGIVHHIETVARAVDIPLIVLNAPDHTGIALHPDSVLQLAGLPSVAGIVEAGGGDAGRAGAGCGHPAVLSGQDRMLLPFHLLGGAASLSAVANVLPATVVALCRACHDDNLQDALALQDGLLPMLDACTAHSSPAAIKCALHLMLGTSPEVRLPLVPADAAMRAAMSDVLHLLGEGDDSVALRQGIL